MEMKTPKQPAASGVVLNSRPSSKAGNVVGKWRNVGPATWLSQQPGMLTDLSLALDTQKDFKLLSCIMLHYVALYMLIMLLGDVPLFLEVFDISISPKHIFSGAAWVHHEGAL